MIGPGKVLDTDKYFILCSDSISNINFYNPNVITTGPASINPKTGKEYAMSFPIFTIKDMVRLQKKLLESLGIQKLKAVLGPSMGGLQALTWGRYFSDDVEKVLAIGATPMIGAYGIMVPNQMGIEAIMLDPDWNKGDYYGKTIPRRGLVLAFKILLMATRTEGWSEKNFGREFADPTFQKYENPFASFDGKFLVEKEVENIILGRMQFFDPNSYAYIAKTNTLFDLREKQESFAQALGKIKSRTLMIIDESDLMFTKAQSELCRPLLPQCECFYYNSGNGHLSVIYETNYFAQAIANFLQQ